MLALVGTFNQEQALVWALSMIVKTDGSFAALVKTEVSGLSRLAAVPCLVAVSPPWYQSDPCLQTCRRCLQTPQLRKPFLRFPVDNEGFLYIINSQRKL